MEENTYYTANELAALTRQEPKAVLKAVKDGRLKGVKSGGEWRFTAEQAEAYAASPETKAALLLSAINASKSFGESGAGEGCCARAELGMPREKSDEFELRLAELLKGRGESRISAVCAYDKKRRLLSLTLFAQPSDAAEILALLGEYQENKEI